VTIQYTERRALTHAPLVNLALRHELIDADVIRPRPGEETASEIHPFFNVEPAPVLRLRSAPSRVDASPSGSK